MSFRRRSAVAFAACWAALGGVFSLAVWLPGVNDDARALGIGLAVVGSASALGAAVAIARGHSRLGGGLLVVSTITPMGFAFLPNLIALVLGLALLIRPQVLD